MKKIALTLSVALASLLATASFAQPKGEADAEGAKALPAKAATKEEKATAKQARKTEGAKVAKSHATSGDQGPNALQTQKISKTDKKSAAIKRKAAGTEARKAGAGSPDNK